MATEPQPDRALKYFRAGATYLATRENGQKDGRGVLWIEGDAELDKPRLLGSIYVHVSGPWDEVAEADVPEAMRRLVEAAGV